MVKLVICGDQCFLVSTITCVNKDFIRILENLKEEQIKELQKEFKFSSLIQQGKISELSVKTDFTKNPAEVEEIKRKGYFVNAAHETILDYLGAKNKMRKIQEEFNKKSSHENKNPLADALMHLLPSSCDAVDC